MDIDVMMEGSFWRDIIYEIINSMDPWDINISELATKYSQRVEEMTEMNFRIPANVVLVSSVLLRMKADIMASEGVNPLEFAQDVEDGLMFNEFDFDEFSDAGLEVEGYEDDEDISSYPDGIPISVKPKRVSKRRVTAEELIAAIQEVLEDRKIKTKLATETIKKKTIEIIVKKDIRALIEETYHRIMNILSKKKDEMVLFSEMTPEKNDIIPTFMSLLHLSNDQKVTLSQEKIFDEIFIKAK